MNVVLGVLTGTAILSCCFWTSYLLAVRLTGAARPSERWSATAVVAYWLLIASFTLFAWLQAFRVPVVLPAWIVGSAVTHRLLAKSVGARELLRNDGLRIRELFGSLARTPFRWLLLGSGFVVMARLLRGLVAPPLGWDELTYHLLKAGRWVQTGGFLPEAAPDAWGAYEYFPHTGEILWAWAMLPFRSDGLVTPAGILIWFSCLLGAYAVCRRFGADEARSALVAVTVGFTSAIIKFTSTASVDNTTLAAILLGTVFLARERNEASSLDALLVAGAFGVAAGTKLVAVPISVLAIALTSASVLRYGGSWRRRLALILGCAAAASLAAPPYMRAWIETGSPLYPFSLAVGDWLILPGHEGASLFLSGQLHDLSAYPPMRLLRKLFVPDFFHRGWGPTAPFVLVLGLLGGWRLLRQQRTRRATAFLLVTAVVVVSSVLPDTVIALRTKWAGAMGRILVPAFVAMAVLGSVVPGRVSGAVWVVSLVSGLILAIPLGWSSADLQGVLFLGTLVAGGVVGLFLIMSWVKRGGQPVVAALLSVGLVAACAVVWTDLRGRYRYRIYAAAAEGRAHDQLPINRAAWSWPIWRYFDGPESHRLAVTAGWDGVGHNWFRYPLLGSRLQNEVLYVTPTADGGVVEYRRARELQARASFCAWVNRLVQEEIDHVVALPPKTVERRWMVLHPRLFRAVARNTRGSDRAYRFERDLAFDLLEGGRCGAQDDLLPQPRHPS